SGSPITPVEARKTSVVAQPTALAAASAVASVAARPLIPVKALALPELTTTARAFPCTRLRRQKSTGADGQSERVNTPAASAGRSKTISITSVRPLYLIPAAAVAMRTPWTTGIVG